MTTPILFIAGATGYTGRALVAQARQHGLCTVAHVRPDSPHLDAHRQAFTALGAEVDTTPWEAAAMTRRLSTLAPSHVFALLGTTRKRAKAAGSTAKDHYLQVDFGLTHCLIDALAAAPATRFIYLSSIGVKADSASSYLQARWRVEAALAQSALPYIIARPSFISGPNRDEARPAERIAARLGDATLALAGALGARHLRQRYRSIDDQGLARALLALALDPTRVREVIQADALQALAEGAPPPPSSP